MANAPIGGGWCLFMCIYCIYYEFSSFFLYLYHHEHHEHRQKHTITTRTRTNRTNRTEKMAQQVQFTAADISRTPRDALLFPADPKSRRAEAASRRSVANATQLDSLDDETLFQIVSLENLSQSRASQLDELLVQNDWEAVGADRLKYGNQHQNQHQNQRVIRDINVEDDEAYPQQNQPLPTSQSNLNNYFKLTLQDAAGNLIYGIEIEKLTFLTTKNLKSGFPIQLGAKLLVKKGAKIVEGVLFLRKENVDYLGGIVPEWNGAGLGERHIAYLKAELDKLPGKD